MESKTLQRYPFFILWGLSLLGYWAILPYISHLGMVPEGESFISFFFFGSLQVAITSGILLALGYLLLKQVDLDPFQTDNWVFKILVPGVVVGLLLGFCLHYLDYFLFSSFRPLDNPPRWMGALASLYGAINEEVFARIFLLPLFFWILTWILRGEKWTRDRLMVGAILLSAIVFALSHLPAGVALGLVSFMSIFRILLLNILAGGAFGFLFCYYGFWSASLAHLITDLILHAIF